MDIVFYIHQDDLPPLTGLGYKFTLINTEQLEGIDSNVAIALASAALTFKSITEIVKLLVERHRKISMSIGGNQYLNIDKQMALKILKTHYDKRLSQSN